MTSVLFGLSFGRLGITDDERREADEETEGNDLGSRHPVHTPAAPDVSESGIDENEPEHLNKSTKSPI